MASHSLGLSVTESEATLMLKKWRSARLAHRERRAETRRDRLRYPTKWLSYRARLENDLEWAYQNDEGSAFFNNDYISSLKDIIRQLESWQIKILSMQLAISSFLLIGFISRESSITLFGVALKQAVGLKEILLSLSATLTVLMCGITTLKDTRFMSLANWSRCAPKSH
jgi:hypothetical protein